MNPEQTGIAIAEQSIEVGNPEFAWLLAFALVIIAMLAWAGFGRSQALKSFGSQSTSLHDSARSTRMYLSGILLVATTTLLTIALVDLRWGKSSYEVPQKGLEVVFALDVSRSMLAQDAAPNRLIRAKQQVKDLVAEMAGDRIGLVAFAGDAQQVVPLTNHYDDFEIKLDSIGPHTVPVGGSRLSVAIKAAADSFIGKTDGNRTIVLFTDGEDQESDPVQLARQLHDEQGIRIFTIGLGDMDQGARIPNQSSPDGSFVEFQGQQVWSKLNGQILKQIATETEAAYIPAGTKRVNMSEIYYRYIDNVEKTQFESAKIDAYTPRFQWFAGAAFVCLLLEVVVSTFTRTSNPKRSTLSAPNDVAVGNPQTAGFESGQVKLRNRTGAASVLIALLVSNNSMAQEMSVEKQINHANELVRKNLAAEAIEAFEKIDPMSEPDTAVLRNYNLAVARYRNAEYDSAIRLFQDTARAENTNLAANSRFNLGNCNYAKAVASLAQQPDQAIPQLQAAIANYRSALRLDRSNADARTNIELAMKLLDQLRKEQEQPQPTPDQQSGSNEDRDDQTEQQNNQQDESKDQSESNQDESESEQSGQKNQPDQVAQNEQQKGSESDPASNDADDEQDMNPTDQEGPPQQETDAPRTGEPSVPDKDSQQNDQPAPSPEQKPDQRSAESDSSSQSAKDDAIQEQRNLKDAKSEGDQENENDQKTEGELTTANENSDEKMDARNAQLVDNPDTRITREEALKLLQSVRDRDMLRRFQNQRRQRSRRVRVEKDW